MTKEDWIKVTDKLPDEYINVLLAYHNYRGEDFISVGYRCNRRGKAYFNIQQEGEWVLLEFIDFWLPIVEPVKI